MCWLWLTGYPFPFYVYHHEISLLSSFSLNPYLVFDRIGIDYNAITATTILAFPLFLILKQGFALEQWISYFWKVVIQKMRRSLPYCCILTQEKAVRCFVTRCDFPFFGFVYLKFYIQSTLQIKLLVFLFAFPSTHYFTAVFCSRCGPGYVRLRTMLMITHNNHTPP